MNLSELYKGAYINGRHILSSSGKIWENRNPYRWDEVYFNWTEDSALVSEAIQAAQQALPQWSQQNMAERIKVLRQFEKILRSEEENIEEIIIAETGKARWEALLEAKALASKVQISLDVMLPAMEAVEKIGFVENRQYMKWKPRGICAVLGPFNFPLHLANGHIIPALLAGNTVIYKSSEYAPACASFYSQLMERAGIPAGVFQFVPGGAETGKALVENPEVRGIFFTGSYANGKRITESLLRSRTDLDTLAALELGGKNATIIHEDADIRKAVGETWMSAFATAGQRCSCSSRVFVHEKQMKKFQELFLKGIEKIRIGDPKDPNTFMGPMIHPQAVDSFFSHLETAKKEGFQVLLESKRDGCLVSPSVYLSENSEQDTLKSSLLEEFFGPNCILIPYKSVDDLIRWHERAPYALVTSLFTSSDEIIKKIDAGIEVGLLNINRASVGASSQLAFGGRKKSGNNWPAGIFSYFYCASPRSYLKEGSEYESLNLPSVLQTSKECLE